MCIFFILNESNLKYIFIDSDQSSEVIDNFIIPSTFCIFIRFICNSFNFSYILFSQLLLHHQSIDTHKSQRCYSEYPLAQMMA